MEYLNVIYLIFAIISSIATAIYAFITFRTLREIKLQRESMYKPELIICNDMFYLLNENENSIFPGIYSFKEKPIEESFSENTNSNFKYALFNIGLGTAKNINISYNYSIEKSISIINELIAKLNLDKEIIIEHNINVEVKDRIKTKTSYNGIMITNPYSLYHSEICYPNISLANEIEHNHILPVSYFKDPYEFNFPRVYCELFSIYIFLINKLVELGLNLDKSPNLLEFPEINIKISYYDISNLLIEKLYKCNFEIISLTNTSRYLQYTFKEINLLNK